MSVLVPGSLTSYAGLEIRQAEIKGSLYAESLLLPSGGFVDVAARASLCINDIELKQSARMQASHSSRIGKCEQPAASSSMVLGLAGSLTLRYHSLLEFVVASNNELPEVVVKADGDISLKDGAR